jgi:hypothetical protein
MSTPAWYPVCATHSPRRPERSGRPMYFSRSCVELETEQENLGVQRSGPPTLHTAACPVRGTQGPGDPATRLVSVLFAELGVELGNQVRASGAAPRRTGCSDVAPALLVVLDDASKTAVDPPYGAGLRYSFVEA